MEKKVTLLELVGTKTIYAVLISLYYWMCARRDWNDYYVTIQYALAIFTITFLLIQYFRINKYKQEAVDELAKQNLDRANTICINVMMIATIIIAFAGALEFINHIMMGYALVWTLVVVSILRTASFYIMDVKGI